MDLAAPTPPTAQPVGATPSWPTPSAAVAAAASASAAATAGAASAATPQIQTRTRSVPTRAATYSLRSSTKVSRIRSSHSRESSSKTAVQGASGHRCSSSPNVTKVLGKKILTPAAAAASPLGKRRRAARLRRTQQRISAAQAFWQRILEELSEAPGKCDVCGGAEATEVCMHDDGGRVSCRRARVAGLAGIGYM
ncbi:hypothetical protein cyc_03490 [Cyclospora cayetanensis]|uniref:Uncharacterized protein n=1 Tax=Cyclospora cayetanensis TaxID=88456 RepID=A0A1D3CXP6_9EIME|nr:hypothetical protein cyc_03490 [Cyclospora cayetanensis]